MKRLTFIAVGSAALIAAVTLGVDMLAGGASGATPPAPPVISSGVGVARALFNAADQATLGRIGATGAITRAGSLAGTAFYSVVGSDGGHCYAFGSETQGGLSGGCSRLARLQPAGATVPTVLDMSGVVMNPADGSWKLDTLQGIAADGVAAVGFVDGAAVLHSTPVIGNVYRLAGQSSAGGASSRLVGLDANGKRVFAEVGYSPRCPW